MPIYLYEQSPLSDFQFILANVLHIDMRYFGWTDCISVEKMRGTASTATLFESAICLTLPVPIPLNTEWGSTDLGTLVYEMPCNNLTRVLHKYPEFTILSQNSKKKKKKIQNYESLKTRVLGTFSCVSGV